MSISFFKTQGSILDLASYDSRAQLSQQLQHLGNSFAARASDASWQPKDSKDPIDPIDPKDQKDNTASVTFDLLGLCEVKAFVSIEHDQLLESYVGSMVIHLEAPHAHRDHANLTESNLQTLHSLGNSLSQVDQVLDRRRGSSRSSRSIRSGSSRHSRGSRQCRSSRSSRSSRSRSVGAGSPHGNLAGGAISDLHCGSELQEIVTKLPL